MILNDIHITRFLKNQGRLSRVRNCLTTALLLTGILVLLLASCAGGGREEGKATQYGCEIIAQGFQEDFNLEFRWAWETSKPQATGPYCRFRMKLTYSTDVPATAEVCEGWISRLERDLAEAEEEAPILPLAITDSEPYSEGSEAGCRFQFSLNICGDLTLIAESTLDPTSQALICTRGEE